MQIQKERRKFHNSFIYPSTLVIMHFLREFVSFLSNVIHDCVIVMKILVAVFHLVSDCPYEGL